MVKSYCVKQKKQTECVPGSERYVKARNGRTMIKCTCAECGITKTKFVKSDKTGGALARRRGPSAVDNVRYRNCTKIIHARPPKGTGPQVTKSHVSRKTMCESREERGL